jgi:hypothetical protein
MLHIGWPRPAGTGEQVPIRSGKLHTRQAPLQAVLQQRPSMAVALDFTQWVEAHSPSCLQTAPSIFRPQLPSTHLRPETQSASLPQPEKHRLVERLHEKGAQMVEAPSLHLPEPSQV